MLDAAQFQRRFRLALIRGRGPRSLAAPGFAVYRNTWVKALLDALDANYPVVAALLGPDLFRTVAVAYAKSHPAATPVLALYGHEFPHALARHDLARELPYLGDVARLERLWTECFFAPDTQPLDSSAFSGLWERVLALEPSFHPAARFASFDTPAVTIWTAHQDEFDDLDPVWQPERALVVRNGNTVHVRAIGEHEFELATQLKQPRSLGEALDCVARSHPSANLSAALSMIVSSGALTLAAPAEKD